MTDARRHLRNGIIFAVICAAYFLYMRFVAMALPEAWGGEVNVLVVPFLLGIIGTIAFTGRFLLRLALIVAAAVAVLLIITGGGDPAKPGLHLWVVGAMVTIATVGALVAEGAIRLITKGRRPA